MQTTMNWDTVRRCFPNFRQNLGSENSGLIAYVSCRHVVDVSVVWNELLSHAQLQQSCNVSPWPRSGRECRELCCDVCCLHALITQEVWNTMSDGRDGTVLKSFTNRVCLCKFLCG